MLAGSESWLCVVIVPDALSCSTCTQMTTPGREGAITRYPREIETLTPDGRAPCTKPLSFKLYGRSLMGFSRKKDGILDPVSTRFHIQRGVRCGI